MGGGGRGQGEGDGIHTYECVSRTKVSLVSQLGSLDISSSSHFTSGAPQASRSDNDSHL